MVDLTPAADVPVQRLVWTRRRQLRLLIALLTALTVALAAWYLAELFRGAEREAQQETWLHARVLAEDVDRNLLTTAAALSTLAERGTMRRAIDDTLPARGLLQQQLRSQSHLRSLTLVDANGTVLVSTTERDEGLRLDLDALGRAGADGPLFRLGPLQPIRDLADLGGGPDRVVAEAGVCALPMLTPVPMGAARAPLWLVALINPDYFMNRQRVLAQDTGVRILLGDLQGQVLATTGQVEPASAALAHLDPYTRFLPQREHGSYTGAGSQGQTVVAAFRLSGHWPLIVLAERDLSSVRAAGASRALDAAVPGLLALVSLAWLGLWAERSLRREGQALAEREALHREVAQTEARWRDALDAAGHGVWAYDFQRQSFTLSAGLNRLLGRPAVDQHMGLAQWQWHIHAQDLEPALALLRSHVRGAESTYQVDLRLRVHDSGWLWVHIGGSVTRRSADGDRAQLMSGTVTDISDRKAAESALQASQARLRGILSSALDGIVSVDAQGRLIDFNPAAERIFGRSLAEVLGQPMDALLVPPAHRLAHDASMTRYRKSGAGSILNRRRVVEGLRANGEVFPMELAVVQVVTDAGEVFTATVRDISQSQRVQLNLAASEERFRAAFEQAAVGLVQQDQARRVVRANPAICRMLGRRPEEMTRLTLRDLLHPDDFEAGEHDGSRLFSGERASFTAERRYRHRDGHYVWGRVTASVTRRPDGTPDYLLAVIEDVSERRRAQAELEQAQARELALGARIQRSLLAHPVLQPQPGLWLSSYNQASQGVDGDFFDVVSLGDHGVDLILGDVMGKGVAAALMGAATKMQFSRSMAELLLRAGCDAPAPTPASIVAAVHRAMGRKLQSLEAFVTLSYLRLDLRAGRVIWVGCGHEEPLLLRAGGERLTLANQHPPLGVLDELEYTQHELAFDHGDAVFLASDGAADALLPDGSRYGRERIATALDRLCGPGQPPASVLHALRAELAASGAQVSDDLTLALAMRVEDPRGDRRCELFAGLDDVGRVRELVQRHALSAGLDEVASGLFTLGCVEAYTNAVRHTRGSPEGAPTEVVAQIEPDALVVEIIRVGEAFQPVADPVPTGFEDYPEGGFGLEIIHRVADRVDYGHRAGVNTVRLTHWRDPTPR